MKKQLLKLAIAVIFPLASFAQCPEITCPSDINISSDPGSCDAVVTYTTPQGADPCAGNSQTFGYTGGVQTFVVPSGVTSIDVDVYGAAGGGNATSLPGLGGRVQATYPVTAGQTLYIYVGGAGDPTGIAGYNGGGSGFGGSVATPGSGGGGASDIRIGGTTLNDRVIVAGGGGGAADNGGYANGAAGGGLTGASASCSSNPWSCTSLTVATGGTQTSGGLGGTSASCAWNGSDGSLGLGGNSHNNYRCGGGGGGYYGGGGGHNGCSGGGGSSYTDLNSTSVIHTQGVKTGNGEIVITIPGSLPLATTQTAGLPSGSTFPLGTTVNTYEATDAFGNTATCSFNVIVTDGENPTITAPADLTVSSDASSCDATGVALGSPITADNCNVNTVTNNAPGTFPLGSTTVTWTVTDDAGNTATADQIVTVEDNLAPTVDSNNLADVTVECELTSLTVPTATDACDGSITGVSDAVFPIDNDTVVVWTYTDASGNVTTQNQNILITGINIGVSVSGITLTSDNSNADTYQWINCADNSVIANASQQSFTPTANGDYAVIVTQENCTDTSDCESITTVGLEENILSNITLYPNPNDGHFHLNFGKTLSEVNVYITDLQGRVVKSEQLNNVSNYEFNINSSAGSYLVEVTTGKYRQTLRVVKQ